MALLKNRATPKRKRHTNCIQHRGQVNDFLRHRSRWFANAKIVTVRGDVRYSFQLQREP